MEVTSSEVTSSLRFLLLFFRTEAQAHGSRLGQAYRPTPVRLCLTQLHNHNGLLRTPPPPDLARCKCNAIGPGARACAGGRPAGRQRLRGGSTGVAPDVEPVLRTTHRGGTLGHGLLRPFSVSRTAAEKSSSAQGLCGSQSC